MYWHRTWTLPLLARMPEVHEAIPNPFRHGEFNLAPATDWAKRCAKRHTTKPSCCPTRGNPPWCRFFAGIPKRTGYRGEMR